MDRLLSSLWRTAIADANSVANADDDSVELEFAEAEVDAFA